MESKYYEGEKASNVPDGPGLLELAKPSEFRLRALKQKK